MWVVRMSDKQLEVLRALLRSEEHLGPALKGAVEALDLARWDDLPEAELPWEEIESDRPPPGHLPGDVIWDLAGEAAVGAELVVAVEAGAAYLRPELAFADHLDQQLRGLLVVLAGGGVEGVADRLGDVEADEVEQGQRAHRVAGAELHAGVDLARLHAGLLDEADGVEEVGEEQAVDDEAGQVGDLDRGLAQRRAPGERLLAGAPRRRRGSRPRPASSAAPG